MGFTEFAIKKQGDENTIVDIYKTTCRKKDTD
jgi:hypothetical protein